MRPSVSLLSCLPQGEVDTGFDDLIVAGRYLDRYERRDGVWKWLIAQSAWMGRTTPTNDPYYEMMPDSLFGSRLDDAVYDRKGRYKRRSSDLLGHVVI